MRNGKSPATPIYAWPDKVRKIHADWWEQRIARQKEIDASIADKADYEYLYDKPFEDNKKVRVAGPFTVESLSPHRLLGVDENDELIDNVAESKLGYGEKQDFAEMILEHLKTSGVQQAHKDDRIAFSAIKPWPGDLVCAEGTYVEGDADSGAEKRAGILIGPEFGTVSRPDLVKAAREAADADFDVLIACAFNYEAHASEFNKLGRIPDPQGAHERRPPHGRRPQEHRQGQPLRHFRRTGHRSSTRRTSQIQVKVNGVDVFHPNTGEIRSDNADGIACWFIDTDYNERASSSATPTSSACQRPLPGSKDDAQGRDQPGSLGNPPQRHFPAVRQADTQAVSPSKSSTKSGRFEVLKVSFRTLAEEMYAWTCEGFV